VVSTVPDCYFPHPTIALQPHSHTHSYSLLHTNADSLTVSHDDDVLPFQEDMTPLHYAALNGHEDAVRALLKWKADIAAVNKVLRVRIQHRASKRVQRIAVLCTVLQVQCMWLQCNAV